jgi:hypothetical protein
MADLLYNSALDDEAKGLINYDTGTFKVMLVTSTYVPDIDTHVKKSDVTNEVTGAGYTAGGEEVAVTVTKSTANDRVVIEFAAASWSTATITAAGAVYYQLNSGTPADSLLVGYNDFGGDVSSTGGTFSIAASTLTKQNNSTGA